MKTETHASGLSPQDFSHDLVRCLEAENACLRAGLRAVEDLIRDSYGVDGLHRNGDVAPWTELRTGGRFEEWLREFDTARLTPPVKVPPGTYLRCDMVGWGVNALLMTPVVFLLCGGAVGFPSLRFIAGCALGFWLCLWLVLLWAVLTRRQTLDGSKQVILGLGSRLAWRFKLGWECMGGHAVDVHGQPAWDRTAVAYRYVWLHKRSREVRFHDQPYSGARHREVPTKS